MGGTVTTDLTPISLCEDTSGWATIGSATIAQNLDIYVQGSASISSYKASAVNHGANYDLGAGGTSLASKVVYCWFAFSKKENIPVFGSTGLRIRLTDTSGNWSEWDIAGSDTLPHGGWIAYAVHTDTTPSRNGGTPATLSSIRYVGWRCDSVVAKTYIYFDAWRYGTYMQIYGGTSGDPANFEACYQADIAAAYGMIDKVFGVYFMQGSLKIGSTSASVATYFESKSKVVVFKNGMIPATYYEISNLGNSGADTEIYIGEASGSRGISGNVFRTELGTQTPKFKITLTDTNRQKFGLYGCSFIDAGVITLPAHDTNQAVISCNFESCSQIDVDSCTMTYCNIIDADTRGILINNDPNYFTNSNIINCPVGIHFDTAGEYDLSGISFSGNTYDLENSTSGGTVDVVCASSDPSTHTETGSPPGTTNIETSVYLKVYVTDEDGDELSGIRVSIYRVSDSEELMNTTTNVDGYAEALYQEATGVAVSVRARKSSTGSTRYYPINQSATIGADGLTMYLTMVVDPIVAP